MQFQDLVAAFMEARNKARLQGRPLSAQETRGLSEGWFSDASNKALQGRALNFKEKYGEDALAMERWKMQEMLNAAKKGNRNQLIGNALKSGVSLAGLYYNK